MRAPRVVTALAHLLPGFTAAAQASAKGEAPARRASTAVPVTHASLSQAESRRACRQAVRAERARWRAVVSDLPDASYLPAAVSLLSSGSASAATITTSLAVAAASAAPPALTGRARLHARIAQHRARVEATPPDAAAAEAADDAAFARFASATMEKVRSQTPTSRPMHLLRSDL